MSTADELRRLADDPDLMQKAHVAVENVLIEWRDDRLSMLLCANGLVVKEKDGTPSSIIRLGTRAAIQLSLRELANILEEEK